MASINLTPTRVTNLKYVSGGPKIQRLWDAQVPGLGLEIFKSNRKSFILRYNIGGKQRIITLGKTVDMTLSDAREDALAKRKLILEGIDPKQIRVQKKVDTVQALFDKYTSSRYFKSLSNDYQVNFLSVMRLYLLPEIGTTPVLDVKRIHIKSIVEALLEAGKEGACRSFLSRTRTLFNYAVEEDLIEWSPADKIKPRYITSGKRGREATLTDDQIRRAWNLPVAPQVQNLVRWLLLTACRRDEARKTRREDLEDGTWYVEDTKTEEPLELPITPMMREILDQQQELFPFSDWLFPAINSSKQPLSRGTLGNTLRRSTQEFTPHILRHVVSTRLADLGVLKEHRDLILNHASGAIDAVYTHSSRLETKRETLELWHTHLSSIVDVKLDGEPGWPFPADHEFDEASA